MKGLSRVPLCLAVLLCAGLLTAGQAQIGGNQQRPAIAKLDMEVPAVVGRSALVGRSNPTRLLHVSVSLPPADPAGLQAYADSVSNPTSLNYRAFLTPEQVGMQFGLTDATIQQVTDYLKSQGFQIKLIAKNRLNILADCTVAQAEAAFGTQINEYSALNPNEAGNARFYSYSQPLQVPAALKAAILDVSGLESFTRPQLRALTPTQTRTLYNLAPIYTAGMRGEGRTVGISNWDGYRLTNVPLYYTKYSLPTPSGGVGSNVTVVTVSGGAGSGSPSGEGDLDIQMVLGMAPLCNLRIYDGGSSDLIGVLTKEVNDNAADIITESYGWSLPASTATSAHNLHLSMTAQGITYMAASGDSGTTLEPYSYPDYDPEVLMVGGTIATTDSSGNRTSEVGWSGSGGGWSTNTATFNKRPSWQTGTGVPTTNYRLVPDVALHASGGSSGAYYFYYNGSLSSGYVGTSFASPVFAGSLAVAEQKIIGLGGLTANSAGKQRLGRIQDVIYSQNGRSDVWTDIVSGSNGKLPSGGTSSAGTGWDFVTGWGAINFDAFVTTQVSTGPNFTLGATPASQSVVQGNGTTYTATVTPVSGYASAVALSVTGLPTGASGTFNPSSLTSGSSTLSVTTASSTPTGTYTLTITGTDGTLTHTTTVTLVVTAPVTADFTLTASPTSLSVRRSRPNGGAQTTVTISPAGGFTGSVTLSAAGLPSRTTATFATNPVTGGTGSSVLTLLPSSSTPTGTYTVTVKGTSGALSHTATVQLTVSR